MVLINDDPLENPDATLWNSAGERAGVRWYTRPPPPSRGQVLLPVVRADGYIDGGWRADEVLAVIHSFGARRVCKLSFLFSSRLFLMLFRG